MQSRLAVHLTKQAIDVKMSEKAAKRMPAIIAPMTLVAAKVIPNRITAARSVTRIPKSSNAKVEQIQSLFLEVPLKSDLTKSRISAPKAMPKVTQRKAAGKVMTRVKRSTPATIPIMMEAVTAKIEQSIRPLHLQLQFIIFSPLFIL